MLEEEEWKRGWQLTGRQGMIDPTEKYRHWVWIPLLLKLGIVLFCTNFEGSETIITHTACRPAAAFSYAADSAESLADPWQNFSGFLLF